jgi:hypothetical protein
MSRVLNVSENNYRLRVQSGGTIILDTGIEVGDVRITGNLIIDGTYTTVNVTEMYVEDNTIILNNGEQGSGITEDTAGITIDRGSLTNAEFLFDETVQHYDPYSSTNLDGTFVLRTDDGHKSGLQLSTIRVDGEHNLYFDIKGTNKSLELVNTDAGAYATRVFGTDPIIGDPDITVPLTAQDNFIVNKRYVQMYIQAGNVTPGVADVDKITYRTGGTILSRTQAYSNRLDFFINESLRSRINSFGLYVDNVNLFTDTITNTTNNLVLTANNNNVEVDAIINLNDQLLSPGPLTGTTKIFSKSQLTTLAQTPGRSGIFFANNIASDELVAKNRALLFSMLF